MIRELTRNGTKLKLWFVSFRVSSWIVFWLPLMAGEVVHGSKNISLLQSEDLSLRDYSGRGNNAFGFCRKINLNGESHCEVCTRGG